MDSDRYQIIRVLDEHARGKTYLGYDKKLERNVLIKEYIDAGPGDQAIRPIFANEVKLLVGINHPGVPQVFDTFENNGKHYLIMEFFSGDSLADRIVEGALDIQDIIGILWQVGMTLDAIHEKGIYHGDVKPGNILIDDNGDARLIDFDIAGHFDEVDRTLAGTPGFAAPEQYTERQLDERADIYALGATLLAMLTGISPSGDLTPISDDIYSTLPVPYREVVLKAMAPRREDRFDSGAALAMAFDEANQSADKTGTSINVNNKRQYEKARTTRRLTRPLTNKDEANQSAERTETYRIEYNETQYKKAIAEKALANKVMSTVVLKDIRANFGGLTPQYTCNTVMPYLSALESIQQVVDEINDDEPTRVKIVSMVQGSIVLNLDVGLEDAFRLVLDYVIPWRRKNQRKLADLTIAEKEAEIRKKEADLVLTKAQTEREDEQFENESNLTEAETNMVVAEVRKIEAETKQIEIANQKMLLEMAQLQLEIVGRIGPDLSEVQRLSFATNITDATRLLATSPLEIAGYHSNVDTAFDLPLELERKELIQSLVEIEGIGPVLANSLAEKFSTLEAIANASIDELREQGIPDSAIEGLSGLNGDKDRDQIMIEARNDE